MYLCVCVYRYEVMRPFVHSTLRRELRESPSQVVYFTGHSLGGAVASIAALDVKTHTLARVNAWLHILR